MMRSREMNPGLGRAGSVKPRLECLEDRCCPTAMTSFQQGILTVKPTNPTNTVIVSDYGQGKVTTTVDGHTQTYLGVKGIDIEAMTGNDQIKYTLIDPLKQSEQLTLHLGNGDDQARLDFSKGIESPKAGVTPVVNVKVISGGGNNDVAAVFGAIDNADLNLTAQLGSGWDHFQAQFLGNLSGRSNVNVNVNGGGGVSGVNIAASGAIAAYSSLSVKVADGSNDDTSSVNYSGKLSGHLSIQENAGAGWDWLETDLNLAAGSNGWLAAHEVGGAGADLLILQVRNGGSLKGLDGLISNVNSSSAVSRTANVKVSSR